MDWPFLILKVLAGVLQVYMIILILRIFMTWLSMDRTHPAVRFLSAVSDPYLSLFTRFRRLRVGNLDFSPIVALLVIQFISTILSEMAQYGRISLGIVLAILISMIWGVLQFFLIFFFVFILIRFLAIKFRWSGVFWSYFDVILQPLTYGIAGIFGKKRLFPYTKALILSAVLFALIWVAGYFGINFLISLTERLPF